MTSYFRCIICDFCTLLYKVTSKSTGKNFVTNVSSSVSNRRVGRNKRAGEKIIKKTLNVQDKINVQGENLDGQTFANFKKVQIHVSKSVPNKTHHIGIIMSTF